MRIYTLAHAALACSLSRCDKKFFSQGTARHSVRFSGAKPAFWISCTAVDVTKSAERDWQLLAGCVIIYLAYSSCSRSYKTHSETCVISEKGKTFFKKRTCYRGQYMSGSDSGIQCRRDLWCTSYRNDRLSGKDIKKAGNRKELNLVLVADFHLGYSIGSHMQRMVEKINASKPDLVVIAGDIFDNEYEALDNPERLEKILRSIKSRYGVYACYGNHDIQEKILAGFTFPRKGKKMSDPRMDTFLEKSNIHLLRDEAVEIDNAFYLFGRADYERPGRGIRKRKLPKELVKEMDQKKPILVVDHEPRELKELADAGVDLDLCGHTHDGQMFPGNLVTDMMWENSYGYLKKGKMHNIVTSGLGVFGPDMRVGTKSEICRIKIKFN